MSEFTGLEVVSVSEGTEAPIFEGVEDGKGKCPDCGKVLTITAAGSLRQHKCINDVTVSRGGESRANGKRPRTPASVRNLGVALTAGAVEFVTANTLASYVPCNASEVPADLGDHADEMIGPILDAIWPRVPKGAQKVLKSVADESDLIAAAMAWFEYGSKLKAWADREQVNRSSHEAPTRGYQNEPVPSTPTGDPFGGLGLVPFTPDTASGETA